MKKLLYCASNNRHLKHFHIPYINMMEQMGLKVDILSRGDASDFKNNDFYNINFEKSILSLRNIQVVLNIKKILKQNQYNYIYLNTSLTAALVRLAVPHKLIKQTKIINLCHGYFFDNGISNFKNILYITIERLLKNKTDHIITMNQTDFNYTQKLNLCISKPFFVNGMGLDISKYTYFRNTSDGESINLVYAAEHSDRKNHQELFLAIKDAISKGAKLKVHLAGDGALFQSNQALCTKLSISDHVIFYGYTNDINSIYNQCDYSVCTSKIEGLPFNVMECLACGLPCIVSDAKGNKDLITNNKNGFVYQSGNVLHLSKILLSLTKNTIEHKKMKEYCPLSIQKNTLQQTKNQFQMIFNEIFEIE